MREALKDPFRLKHMYDALCLVNAFMDGKQLNDLLEDKLLFYGVVKNIEIIGEAAYKLTQEFKDTHPETPWRDIVGMRHVLVHGYYSISPKALYKVYTENLPILLEQLQVYVLENPI